MLASHVARKESIICNLHFWVRKMPMIPKKYCLVKNAKVSGFVKCHEHVDVIALNFVFVFRVRGGEQMGTF